MKYIEQTKSFFLTFLVLLSLVLTLMIWSYKPDYELIEETQVDEILVGEEKELRDVLKPYRLLFRQDDAFYGTVSSDVMSQLYSHLTSLQTSKVDLINSKLTDVKMNEIIRMNNRLTLFFNGEIPLEVFSGVIPIQDKQLPEGGFTRLILDWSTVETNDQLQLLFLNTEKRVLFRAYAEVDDVNRFIAEFVTPAKEYSPYTEVMRDSLRSLYVAEQPIELIQYTHIIDWITPDPTMYKNVLFNDLSIVQHNIESTQSEKYTDGTSLMTVDTQNRILNYVYPPAESIAPVSSDKLLFDSFDFVNDHGGFTADYRFSSMNIEKHMTEYQQFLQGYPIYSNITARITTTWGENRIFRYRRPYYSIESNTDITTERAIKKLVSGEEVIEFIRNMSDHPFENIDEIVVGYYLMQDPNFDLFLLEPGWFIISNNAWTHILPEQLGGMDNGLE